MTSGRQWRLKPERWFPFEARHAHIIATGATYDAMAAALPTADHPFSGFMNRRRARSSSPGRLRSAECVAGEGTRLFDDVPKSYRLDLVSSTEFSNGIVGLQYRRHRFGP